MDPIIAKHLARNPKAQLDYRTRGKLPRTFVPQSPLIKLLEAIGPRRRRRIVGITLSPALGYQPTGAFPNAEALLRWLKPAPKMVEGQPFPAESRRLKAFNKRLTEDDLKPFCTRWA